MAVVSVNKGKIHRLAESGNKNAALIERLMEDSTVFLSTIQVAITLAGFFSSASAATGIAQVLAGKIAEWNIPYSQSLAGVVVTIILAYFNLVFGELVPKRIALQKAEWFSLFCVRPIYYISLVMNRLLGFYPVNDGGFKAHRDARGGFGGGGFRGGDQVHAGDRQRGRCVQRY